MSLKKLFKNLYYLHKVNLIEMMNSIKKINGMYDDMNRMLDNISYELPDHLNVIKKPKIKNIEDTIADIKKKKASFCRFGDGELLLMTGSDIGFQKYDSLLAKRLEEVISSNKDNIFIGINYHYYHDISNFENFAKKFYRLAAAAMRGIQEKYINYDNQYYSAGITSIYVALKNYDFQSYFKQIQEIWKNRDITIICGQTIFDKIDYNIFDVAASIEYMYAPSQDAFSEYDSILDRARSIRKDRLIIIILGPTAKVLAYDLSLEGYQALDLGHIAKDYDAFCKNIEKNDKNLISFFSPD